MKNALAQEGEASPAIAHAFNAFQLVHFSLNQKPLFRESMNPVLTVALSGSIPRTKPCNSRMWQRGFIHTTKATVYHLEKGAEADAWSRGGCEL